MAQRVNWNGEPVETWADFHRVVKQPGRPLLSRLDDYGGSVLVAGCQRSGTTAVTRLLGRAEGVADHTFGHDDELDGALLLAGYVDRFTSGKHCFQTTYLNDRFPEYFDHKGFRLVWILREPRAVVRSMLYNWKRGALDRLFDACGADRVERNTSVLDRWVGFSRIDKACASYVAKTEQTFALRARLGERMIIVDYGDLVAHQAQVVPFICNFAGLPFDSSLIGHLHGRSLRSGERLASWQSTHVDGICSEVYRCARMLRSYGSQDDV